MPLFPSHGSVLSLSNVLLFLLYLNCVAAVARTNCKHQCLSSWNNKTLFETCLRQCSQMVVKQQSTTRSQKVYPTAPRDIHVDLTIKVVRQSKFVAATIKWKAEEDKSREGFSLSVLATSESCEMKFPGFHTMNIQSNATFFEVPGQTPSYQPLLLDFGCTYQIEMRSKPYPYGDPAFATVYLLEVPTCLEGYCSCRGQAKPSDPDMLAVLPSIDENGNRTKHQVFWRFVENSKENEKVEFRVKVAELLRKANVAPWKKIFRWIPWEVGQKSEQNRERYRVDLLPLIEGNEYKVQVLAFNQHLCRSKEVELEFFATNVQQKQAAIFTVPTTSQTLASPTSSKFATGATLVSKIASTPTSHLTTPTTTSAHHPHTHVAVASQKDEYLVVFLPIICILCLIISAFAVWKFFASRKEKLMKEKQYLQRMHRTPWTVLSNGDQAIGTVETNILYTDKEIADARERGLADEFEVSYERISLGRVIGQGAFGLVYTGHAESIRGISGRIHVAIKQLKANAEEKERNEFLAEIEMMKRIEAHPNIVAMYGCCTLMYPHCMIMEYVPHGDLLKYLRNLRKQLEKQIEEYKLSLERDYIMDLGTHPLMTRVEINAECDKLTTIRKNSHITAYDLMTETSGMNRHCQCSSCVTRSHDAIPFVDSEMQVSSTSSCDSDFGSLDIAELQSFALQVASGMEHLEKLQITHRDLACRNILVGHGKVLKISDFGLSRCGIYVKTTSGRIPLRWLSVEAMRDHAYSTKSDVWAYGVVLWEICTLGGFPYPSLSDKDLLHYLEIGCRLSKPSSCSDEIYALMMQCWSGAASQRPSFATIRQILKEMTNEGHVYVEFSAQDEIHLPPQDYCRIVPLATLDEFGLVSISV